MIHMEASDTSGAQPQGAGEPDATGQDQSQQPVQDSGQPTADSQEAPAADSQLTTPQPDQPIQTEAERNAGEALPTADGVQDQSAPDPAAAETQRQQDLNSQQREHAQRTGGGDVQDGELQNARQEHNDRTGGGQVPGANAGADDGPESGLGQE